MAVYLLFGWMLLSGLVQNSTWHCCVVSILLFLYTFVRVQVVHPYSSIDAPIPWKKSCFILSDKSNFHMIDNLLIAVHAFPMHMFTLLSVDEIMLMRYVNCSTNFRGLPLSGDGSFLFKIHELCLICFHIGANAAHCLLRAMHQRRKCKKFWVNTIFHRFFQ